jgi:hypothetical protein
LLKQAFVSSVNDAFLVAGAITIVCLVPIFFLRRKRAGAGVRAAAME